MTKLTVKKKTKIVATISDKRCDIEFLAKLYQAGMDVVRINTAHQNPEESLKVIRNVRAVSDHIAIMIDTKGPEIRTSPVSRPIDVKKGDQLMFKGDPDGESSKSCICLTYRTFVEETPIASRFLIDDGDLEFIVIAKIDGAALCEAGNDGSIEGNKSINTPNVDYTLPTLSDKDRDYIQFCMDNDVDFIAHSFVRNKNDVLAIQEILDKRKSPIKIIAKIENQSGVDNIDEILDHAYGVMVARGDLAIEIPYERVPGIQKMLIKKCIGRRKPVIIATQMLHSMIRNPRPTRAEVSDIANAIYSKTDAIMLSGETTHGRYPLEAVSMMAKVAVDVEKSCSTMHDTPSVVLTNERSAYLTKTAVEASIRLNASAIVSDTSWGNSIRNIAGFRGMKPVFAHCYDQRVVRQLALSFGVFPDYIEITESSHDFVRKALQQHVEKGTLGVDDLVVVLAGNFGSSFGPSFIEITPVSIFETNRKEA